MLTCKRALAAAWFILGGIAVLILVGQTVTERYGDKVGEVWTWFSVYYLPAATVVIFASTVGEHDAPSNQARVSRAAFVGALLLSILYLILMLLPLLAQPFTQAESPLETLNRWAIVLAIFQSIVVGALAAVYIRP